MELLSENSIKRALAKYFDDVAIKSFKHLKQGVENTSIFVDTGSKQIVIRFWGETNHHAGIRNENDILGELGLMQLFFDNGLPVPKVYQSKHGQNYEHDSDGKPFMVMDFAHGDIPQDFTADMVSQVGKVMGKMHVLVPGFNYPHERAWPGSLIDQTSSRAKLYLEKYGAQSGEIYDFTRMVIREFETMAAKTDLTNLPQGAIHGDIMDENIKFSDGKLTGIFDFDDYRYSYFLEDIVKSLLFNFESPGKCLFGEDGSNAAAFIKAYETERTLTSQENAALPLFYLARFTYNIVTYFRKADQGKLDYRQRIPASIERYKRLEQFIKT